MPKHHLENDDEEDDGGLINVDFDFFSPAPIDFIAIKRLLAQLFQADSEALHTHDLAELVVSQTQLGTTIKTDGIDSDPYAFLTVLNLQVHQGNIAIKSLIEYLVSHAASSPPTHQVLLDLMSPSSNQHVGLILSERLINMPVQVVPHMFRLLSDEIRWAIDENEPFRFSHYICVSRTYRVAADEADGSAAPPSKKLKSSIGSDHSKVIYSYHQEDEIMETMASHTFHFEYSRPPARESGVTGADIALKLSILPASRLSDFVSQISETYASN